MNQKKYSNIIIDILKENSRTIMWGVLTVGIYYYLESHLSILDFGGKKAVASNKKSLSKKLKRSYHMSNLIMIVLFKDYINYIR